MVGKERVAGGDFPQLPQSKDLCALCINKIIKHNQNCERQRVHC